MSAVCTYDDTRHEYRVNARRVPSVTEVLRPFYRNQDRWTEEGRERGKMVHKAVQYFLEGDLDRDSLDPRLAGFVESVAKLDAAIGLRRPSAWLERPLYSETLLFAGTPDWSDEGDPVGLVLDWKSGSIDPVTALQTAGYEILAGRRCRRFGVALRENGAMPKLFEFKERSDRQHFLAALALHQRFIASARPVEVARQEELRVVNQ